MFFLLRFIFLCFVGLLASVAEAKVAVLANRTVQAVTVEVVRFGQRTESMTISSGDSLPLFFSKSLMVRFGKRIPRQQYPLQASSVYFLVRSGLDSSLEIEQIGLGEQPASTAGAIPPVPDSLATDALKPVTIAVKILVDDNEVTHRSIWETKLRKRVEKASQILEQHSGIRLKVVEVATWKSEDAQRDFSQTLRQFEREVKPGAAQLVIGFSSQYQATRGRSHLGVTRWPMHSHILLRERSRNLLEVEKLELLVHELGHYLGATHSPEPQSVMRPVLTRNVQRRVGSRIRFDPVNALIIALVGEEMRHRNVRSIRKISKPTIQRLKEIYGVMKLAIPNDPAAQQYLRLLEIVNRNPVRNVNRRQAEKKSAVGVGPARRGDLSALDHSVPPLVRDTRQILDGLLAAAQHPQQQGGEKITGDELTNYYVRQAASAALRLRSSNNKRAMILALGIFMDDTDTLREFPGTSEFIASTESDEQRTLRIKTLGSPTMRDRNDLVKHFFGSAHLFVVGGKETTVKAGLTKEMLDANGGTGFSFVDMAVNRSGIAFAEQVVGGQLKLRDLTKNFHVDDYLPSFRELDEGISAVELKKRQPALSDELNAIEQRVLDLPVYELPVE